MLRYFALGDDAKEGARCACLPCQPRVRIPQNSEGAAGCHPASRRALIAALSSRSLIPSLPTPRACSPR